MTENKTTEKVPEAGSFVEGLKMVLTVTLVAAISAGLLGFVFNATKDSIADSERSEKVEAFKQILPGEFDNDPLAENTPTSPLPVNLKDGKPDEKATLYTATKDGALVGHVLQMETQAFDSGIKLLVGVNPELQVTGVYILAHKETPGLGAKATEAQSDWGKWRTECKAADDGKACRGSASPFLKQFTYRKADEQMKVQKDDGDIVAITASTITSRGIAKAVVQAIETIKVEIAKSGEGDAS